MSPQPSISFIIVNFNGAAFIKECLDSVIHSRLHYSYEIILVDNASWDQSLDVIEPYRDKLRFVQNTENTGFAYANNQAIRMASGKYIFLLNTDAVLHPDAVQQMVDAHEDDEELGAIAPKLLNADGSLQCPGSSLGHWRFKADQQRYVPFIAGAAVLMRRQLMLDMGMMDENLFFYNDDVDMCRYFRRHKHPILYLPTAKVTHYGGLSTNFRKLGSLIEGYRGGMYLAMKHYGRVANVLYRLVMLVFDLLPRIIIESVKRPFISADTSLLPGYLEVLRIAIFNDVYLFREKERMGLV